MTAKKKPVVSVELAEVIEDVVATPEPARSHVVKDGDTYASIAGLYKPSTLTKHEYATHLFALNKGTALTPGTEVDL
jgi:hypothetical protein